MRNSSMNGATGCMSGGLGRGGGSWQSGQLLKGNHRELTKHLKDSTHTSQICRRGYKTPARHLGWWHAAGKKIKGEKKKKKRKKTKPQTTIHGTHRGLQDAAAGIAALESGLCLRSERRLVEAFGHIKQHCMIMLQQFQAEGEGKQNR